MRQRTVVILWTGLALLLALPFGQALGQASKPAPADAQPTQPAPGPGAAPAAAASSEPAAAQDPYTVTVTDDMRDHQRWEDTLYFAGEAYGLVILLLVLALGLSGRLRDLAARITPRPFLTAMLFFVFFTAVTTLLSFPLDYFGDFVIPHRYALSDQGFGGWLWDYFKEAALGTIIGAPLVALALRGIARFRRWWLVLWIGSIPVIILMILVAPVLLDPVFNDFQPLRDTQLRQEIQDLAARAGITGGKIYEVDKSKQTKEMNAYVNGLGPTKRIVLWDTIIAKMNRNELKFVMAHEMGHYVLHHVWQLVGFLILLLLAVFWVGQRVIEWATRRWGRTWGFLTPHDPAALPLILLVISLFFFFLTPLLNGVSRHMEHQADTFALEMTHLNDAGARAFVKMAEDSKILPDPPAFIRFWRYSHPTLAERIAFCRTYKPWEEGKPNQLWKGK
jgi:STE24 endopeptidase